MPVFRVSKIASQRLDEIFVYTCANWGQDQAERYINGLFACFGQIAARTKPWQSVPSEFAIDGYFYRHEHHFIYWRELDDGTVGIVTILHERMHQIGRYRSDFGI